jgi:hypothetical protein
MRFSGVSRAVGIRGKSEDTPDCSNAISLSCSLICVCVCVCVFEYGSLTLQMNKIFRWAPLSTVVNVFCY